MASTIVNPAESARARVSKARAKKLSHRNSIGETVEEWIPGLHEASKLAKGELPPLSSALPNEQLKELAPGPSKLAESAVSGVVENVPVIKGPLESIESVGTGIQKAASKAANAAGSAVSLAEFFTNASNWARLGKIIAGALIIMFALYLFAKAVSPQAVAAPMKVVKAVR